MALLFLGKLLAALLLFLKLLQRLLVGIEPLLGFVVSRIQLTNFLLKQIRVARIELEGFLDGLEVGLRVLRGFLNLLKGILKVARIAAELDG